MFRCFPLVLLAMTREMVALRSDLERALSLNHSDTEVSTPKSNGTSFFQFRANETSEEHARIQGRLHKGPVVASPTLHHSNHMTSKRQPHKNSGDEFWDEKPQWLLAAR
uniref:Uncharacterized protein n=1 Tax=Noctiluca scintillans TaxID=2966 RepID=A0A7S0ZXY7_NOCSC|mmetsp:Transcript_2306/g.6661  ORF Transcript_2306/g.6661 Transcript_2306/m.6661 type:complete len:109 (+) Transcript_2306:42-368(+)